MLTMMCIYIYILFLPVGVHKLVRGRGGEVEEERVASEYRIVPSCATISISKKSLCLNVILLERFVFELVNALTNV